MKPRVVKFFQFLEAKEGKNAPLKVKLLNQDKFKIIKDELNVKGSLDLSETDIKSLPEGLRIYGYLNLKGCASLTSLSDDLRVDGSLYLEDCTSLTSLPNNLYVVRNLHLRGCISLTSLSDDLRVDGSLYLEDCTSLKTLPNGLRVSWSLDLQGCTSLKTLPKDLQVGRYLYLKNTPLAKMYNVDEIRAMIEAKGGYVGKTISI